MSIKKFGELYDEQITRAVVAAFWKGHLSNNWKLAEVPIAFRRNCYNFSSYFYFDALLTGPNAYHALFRDRILSAILGSLSVIVFSLAALLAYGRHVAVAALAIMAVTPLLVQDSHYARPEAFVTFVFGLVYVAIVWGLRTDKPQLAFLLSGTLLGILIACKISFLPAAVIPFVCLIREDLRTARAISLFIFAVGAGFVLGVPDAVVHPGAFMDGVNMLRNQYTHEHPPYSSPHSHLSVRLLFPYFWQTLGPISCALSLLGIGLSVHEKQYQNTTLFAVPLAFYLGFFAAQRTFFERNLSHVVPLIAILAGVAIVFLARLARAYWRPIVFTTLVLLSCVVPALISYRLVAYALPRIPETYAAKLATDLSRRYGVAVTPSTVLIAPENEKELVKLVSHSPVDVIVPTPDYHDPYTLRMVHTVHEKLGARLIGSYPSLFPNFSTNTMLTYHAYGLRFLLLSAPDTYAIGSALFVPYRRIVQPSLRAPVLKSKRWVPAGVHPSAKIPAMLQDVYGSYTATGGDANTGAITLAPIKVSAGESIGLPLITGPSQEGLSIAIRDHFSQRILLQLATVPNVPTWSILKIVDHTKGNELIDITAQDHGASWGQWLAIGAPFVIRD